MKPTIVLTLICAIICGLLILTYNATYVDTTGVITDSISQGLTDVFGSSEGFEMVKVDEKVLKLGKENSIIVNQNGDIAIEVTADGYSKGGLTAIVGFQDGEVKGVSIIAISETPGLGTKVQEKGFLSQFKGLTSKEYKVNAVTGATYSSKGMKELVDTAIDTYGKYREWEKQGEKDGK